MEEDEHHRSVARWCQQVQAINRRAASLRQARYKFTHIQTHKHTRYYTNNNLLSCHAVTAASMPYPHPQPADEDRYHHTCKVPSSRRTSLIVFIAVSLLFSSVNNVHKRAASSSLTLYTYRFFFSSFSFRELFYCGLFSA